jgi:hypothetical protein
MLSKLDKILAEVAAKPPAFKDDHSEFATSMWTQIQVVTQRMNVALFRNTNYINNKIVLHIIFGLFNSFSF